jgi:hypothetical protein
MRRDRDKQPLIVVTAAAGAVAVLLLGAGRWVAMSRLDLDVIFSEEGGLLEWLAFLALLCAGIALCCVHRLRRKHHGLAWRSPQSVGMLILAGALLVGAFEEISWGQHVIGWRTPEFFRARNLQAETNIHNLEILGVRLNTVVFDRVLFAIVALHNVVLPVVALGVPRMHRWVERIGGFVPPLPLVAVFLAAAALASATGIRRPAELPEAVGSLHYLASILATYVLGCGMDDPIVRTARARRRAAPVIAVGLLSLVAVAVLLTVISVGKPV